MVQSAQPAVTSDTKPAGLYGDPRLGSVVVSPQQIFAVGLNYRHHAAEMNMTLPSEPMVFTKFVSSLCGPNEELPVRGETTDFEAELVIVIGTRARDISEEQALGVVAGYASDRTSLNVRCNGGARRLSTRSPSPIAISRPSGRG